MERKSEDNNANSRFNTKRNDDSSKNSKMDKVIDETKKKLSVNLKKSK